MPGRRASRPNAARAVHLGGRVQPLGRRPDQAELPWDLSPRLWRARAICPRHPRDCRSSARALVAVLITYPFSVRSCDFATPHFCAAASSSMSRADAPALRSGSQRGADAHAAEGALQRTVGGIDRREFGADLLPIAIQLFGQQSARAKSRGPCPISDLWIAKVTTSSLPIWMKAFSFAARCRGGFQLVALGQMESDEQATRGGRAGLQETSAI